MRKDLIYFSVPDKYAMTKLKEYFNSRFFPSVLKTKLSLIETSTYPAFIKLDGSDLELTSKEEVDKHPSNIIVVRHLTRKVVSETVEKVVKDYIDLFPKFRRSDWNSSKVGFRVHSEEDLSHLYGTMLGLTNLESAKSVLSVVGSVVIFTKEGSISVCLEDEGGLQLVKGCAQTLISNLKTAKIVDYTKNYKFTSPIELY
jgi:hypothetical protein